MEVRLAGCVACAVEDFSSACFDVNDDSLLHVGRFVQPAVGCSQGAEDDRCSCQFKGGNINSLGRSSDDLDHELSCLDERHDLGQGICFRPVPYIRCADVWK